MLKLLLYKIKIDLFDLDLKCLKSFKYFGTSILVLNNDEFNKTYEQELTDDLIAIIHYFSMKSYSHRRKLNKLRKELELSEKENKQPNNIKN